MLKKSSFFAILILLFLGLAIRADNRGDNRNDNIVDEIVARVDSAIITRSDFEKAQQTTQNELQQQFPSDWQGKWTQRQKDTLRELIDQQLLLEKGKELGITGDTEVTKQLYAMMKQMGLKSMDELEDEAKKQGISFEDFKEQIRSRVVAENVIGQEVGSKVQRSITSEEVQAWYNKHQKEMEGPEEVSLSEIMVSTEPAKPAAGATDNAATPPADDPAKLAQAEAKANALLDKLRKGAKFEDVARDSSDGPTAAQGGRLGEFKRGELAKDLEDKTFSLKTGEYTDVIKTRQGFIILKVNGHRAAGIPPFKEVEDQVRNQLYGQKMESAAHAYLTKLREEAYIDIKPGYVDTGASPNPSNNPVTVTGGDNAPGKASKGPRKRKKKFLVF